jgi:hypothetical protein
MMRHAAAFSVGNFRRGDLNLAIDLHGIKVDDFAIEGQRQPNPKLAFARSGRADYYRYHSHFDCRI